VRLQSAPRQHAAPTAVSASGLLEQFSSAPVLSRKVAKKQSVGARSVGLRVRACAVLLLHSKRRRAVRVEGTIEGCAVGTNTYFMAETVVDFEGAAAAQKGAVRTWVR
jgi:hypothetical protein